MLARYFFGSAKVWKLSRVPLYRIEEARVILQGQYEARKKAAQKGASGMSGAGTIALPGW